MSLASVRRASRFLLGLPLLTLLFATPALAQTTGNVLINEVDSDTPSDDPSTGRLNDDAEFVELYNAGTNAVDLSGYVLVFFNGNGDTSYLSVDLDGFTVAPGDYFVYCSIMGVTPNCDLANGSANVIQNGPDAVALYTGSAADFPNGTAPVMANLVDALVYDTNDADDAGLLAALGETMQYDEAPGNNGGSTNAIARQPDGSETFVVQLPTPGATNGGGAMGTMLVVTTSTDEDNMNGQCSLREAVRAANGETTGGDCGDGADDGDRITFAATVVAPIVLTMGEITITDDVSIDGSSLADRVTVDAQGNSRIFDVSADVDDVFFTSLILRNGNSGAGGSAAPDAGGAVDLKSGASATFTDVDVRDSFAGINGGGIHGAGNTDITITTTDGGASLIHGNVAAGGEAGMGGGGVWGAGSVTITGNVRIDSNRATGTNGSGGGVFNFGGTLSINGAIIADNFANRAGGGIEDFGDDDDDTDVTLTDVSVLGNFIANAAPGNGGGFHSGGGDAVVTGGLFRANTAVEGGGAWSSGTITFDGTTFSENTGTGDAADGGGGGFYSQGSTATLTNVSFEANVATGVSGSGGNVLVNGGTFSMTGGKLGQGTANRAGGGIEVAGGSATLTDVLVEMNNAGSNPGNGGGLHAGGGTTVSVQGGRFLTNTAVEGGALWSADVLTITGSTVIDRNVATSDDDDAFEGGGGLFNQGGTMTVDGATISNNTATGDGGPGAAGSGGGAFNNGMGTLTISNSTFSNNSSARAGGGIEVNGGAVTLTGVDFRENATGPAPGNGGALHVSAGTVTATGGTVQSNTAATEGGGFWNNAGFTMTVTEVAFNNNVASGAAADNGGGGLFNNGGDVVVDGASFTGNVASGTAGSGGGLLNNMGTVSVRESSFSGNVANRAGGAVEDIGGAGSMASFVDVDMTSNDAGSNPGNGGAIHITGAGTVRVDSSRVTGNTAGGQGGGLWNFGTASMEVTYTTVSGNDAGVGGGLYQQDGADGLLMFRNSTASGNDATVAGGGLLSDGATVQIVNSTLSGNTAPTGAGAATRGGRVLLSNATVAVNVASVSGGGLANLSPDFGDGDASDDAPADASLLSPDNTIVGDNTAPTGANLSGPVTSRGYNLFETTDGATVTMDAAAGDDITGVDAGLQPLADNGGPTLTHAISLDSPAVNVGWTALDIDQRGAERRGTPDIGAFESDAAPTAGEDAETDFADGETIRMTPAAPNPLTAEASLSVSVREAQSVRVMLYDVMGRQVGVLHDGPMAAATPYRLTVDARGLASGVYVVVVRGESVQGTQQITVAR